MNRQRYRLVFNRHLGAMVAVAETARGRGKGSSRPGASAVLGAALALGSVLLGQAAWAQVPVPAGAQPFVAAGQVGYQVQGNQAFVNQVGNKAILNWQSFNVGAGNGVQFRQVDSLNNGQLVPGASFTTLNRIHDLNPSVIAGSITQGAGQKANVILINSNGIAFMGGSQVNVNSFTASTLNMADKYVLNGLLGDLLTPQFEKALDGGEARAFVKVFEGAKLSADSQGRVMLIAPTVINRGTITAPDGQVILAAGTRAFLRADDSADLNLRGLLVEVDSPAGLNSFDATATGLTPEQQALLNQPGDDRLGHASNFGALTAARGNVTMVGYAVNQMGLASATSSVVANGSVYLMAKDTSVAQGSSRDSSRGGQVLMGEGSRTEVLVEKDDPTTSVDGDTGTGMAQASQVRVLGQQIHMASGASIVAPSGDVTLTAVDNPSTLIAGTTLDAIGTPASSAARVHLASGSRIDVAGLTGVEVSAARNSVEVELRGDELKDSPLNRNGPLRGEKVYVDVEQALANAEAGLDTLIAKDSLEAYRARLGRTAAERSTAGGTVAIRSEGEAIVEAGATIDLSGGSIAYQAAQARTTVLAAQGRLQDLADARASTRYDGIASRYVVDYGRWNQKDVYELPSSWRFVASDVQGQNAGSLSVQSMGTAVFGADVQGRTVAGQRQTALGLLPEGARLTIGTQAVGGALKDHKLNQAVVIGDAAPAAQYARGQALPNAVQETLVIDADLLGKDRVAHLEVFTNQAAEVREALRAPQGGSVSIAARDLHVKAGIEAAGGQIDLVSRNNAVAPLRDTTLTVDDGVRLSTAGAWVNDRRGLPTQAGTPRLIDGGEVSVLAETVATAGLIEGAGTVVLGQGVAIDASGGARLGPDGKVQAGEGGRIAVGGDRLIGLQGTSLSAHALEGGGSLAVTSRDVRIDQAQPTSAQRGANEANGLLTLAPDFFTQGGFTDYEVTGLNSLTVAAGTTVAPSVTNRQLSDAASTLPTGTPLAAVGDLVRRDSLLREAVDIHLNAGLAGAGTGTLTVEHGARVEVEPGARIALQARNTLEVSGELVARGGKIDLTLDRSSGHVATPLNQNSLWLGDKALLDASGVARTVTGDDGRTTGQVLAGGRVNLTANTGYVVAEQGARIDVSGAPEQALDVPNEQGRLGRRVASDAGQVNLFAEEGLLFDATLAARAGSANQRSGSFSVTLSKNARQENQPGYDPEARALVLVDRVAAQTTGLTPDGAIPRTGEERAVLGTQALEDAGFDTLRVASRDGIVLADGVRVGEAGTLRELQLDAARIEVRGGNATLQADAVRLGNVDTKNRVGTAGASAPGTHTLTADARLLELAGNLRLQGMAASTLTGTEQVRLAGVTREALLPTGALAGRLEHSATIASQGDLVLRGGVIAPSSYADVTVQATGRDVRFEAVGDAPVAPFSALGRLTVQAQNITQAGRVVAPFGQIDLQAQDQLTLAPGSLTSVSAAAGQVLPLGQVQNGTEWVVNLKPDDVPRGQPVLDGLPEKAVSLSGASVRLQSGATLNVAGGGDLQAYEFSVGPGGSRDILAQPGTYAVLPGYRSGFAPTDPQESTGRAVGEAVYLSGVKGLADGVYTLLPAHYALLPGALAVRLPEKATPLLPGQHSTRADGVQVVAGQLTDTRANAPRAGDWRAVEVLTREQVLDRSEFTLSRASTFFGQDGGSTADAGRLSLLTQGQLELDGRLLANPLAGGRGAAVDISAPKLLIAAPGTTSTDPTVTTVDASRLRELGAESLLLGATRSREGDTTTLSVNASELTVANDAASALSAREVILAARDTLTLKNGSAIDARGADGDAGHYSTEGNGALVRAAATSATFSRTGSPDRSAGTLVGEAQAVVQSDRAIALDATRDNRFNGQTDFRRPGQLSVGAARVSLGAADPAVEGIRYSQAELNALQSLDALSLTSYSTIDLYGDVSVGGAGADGRPTLKSLTLQGAGLVGQANAGQTATVRAQQLVLANGAASAYSTVGTPGAGTLDVQADTLVLGAGQKAIAGFDHVSVRATEVVGQGSGSTTLAGDTRIATTRLTGEAGAQQTLDAGAKALAIGSLAAPAPLAERKALGASWAITAGTLDFDTRAELASGQLSLNATQGDLNLGAQARLDLAGRDQAFHDAVRGSWGGNVTLASASGDVRLNEASRIDVSGGTGADGGRLTLRAAQGEVLVTADNLQGQVRPAADAGQPVPQGASAEVDAGSLANFSTLNAALQAGGFGGERVMRARTGNIDIAATDTVRAKAIQLSADGGSINVAGSLDASGEKAGEKAGEIGLHAGQSVALQSGADLRAQASASGAEGGRVALSAAQGSLDLQSGSRIDVSGGANGQGGTLHLRALRNGNDVNVTAMNSTVTGARRVDLEAVRVYSGVNTLTATGTTAGTLSQATLQTDNNTFAANHAAIKTRLGQQGEADFHVVSGVEVRSTGNLTLGADWNLRTATAGGEAGVLTLRAEGNVALNNNLSDGFSHATAYSTGTTPATLVGQDARGGQSWSYRVIAGADASAADPMATLASDTKGDITVAANKIVRTGTGDIRMAAGRDIKLGTNAVVYTAGNLSAPLAGFVEPISSQRAYFTEGGGDVSLRAVRDVEGTASTQLYSDWLFRQGRLEADAQTYPAGSTAQGSPAWWVRFDQFRQGLGALGGGDVSVSAGRDVRNVSASTPTQGRTATTDGTTATATLVKTGGGEVAVNAGRDVMGGQFYADNGDVRIAAAGQVGNGAGAGRAAVYPVVALGDGQALVRARGDVNLHAVLNPTLLVQSYGANDTFNIGDASQRAQRRALFSTYADDSAARLSSLDGSVVLHNARGGSGVADLKTVYSGVLDSFEARRNSYLDLLSYLPPGLAMTAFSGDVKLHDQAGGGRLTLLPSAQGRLELLARGDVQLNASLLQSDNNPVEVASVRRPVVDPRTVLAPTAGVLHGATPVHLGDTATSLVYAAEGDVRGLSQTEAEGRLTTTLNLAQAVQVKAGGDVRNVNLVVQHANPGDVSVVEAGRDIRYGAGAQRSDSDGIRVGGQGRLVVSAARDVDLGTSGGIVSVGDLDNANLRAQGADIEVLAGTGPKGLDAAGAVQRLRQRLAGGQPDDTDLWLARWLTGRADLSTGDVREAVDQVLALPADTLRERVRDFVFTALRETGRDANRGGNRYAGSFDRGYAALELLFPGIGERDESGRFAAYEGGVNLFASRIKTERGGDIDILVPGGGLVVGLANTPKALVDVGNNVLGVVAAASGDVRAFTRDDMVVNQSRILTVGGGDVLLWSSEGDIDAGKGKKTASAVPPPIIKVDAQGNVTQELQGAASGSGIGALSTAGVTPGDVDLIAPKGTVNAGDAGIRAGNLNIAAQVVLGADNISVSGSSSGTPVADTSAVTAASSGATSGGDDTGKAVAALSQAAAESAKAAQELAASLKPSVVRVEVLGYGE